MKRLSSTSGQLFLPMLSVIVLLGLFFVGYLNLCKKIYWKMRMDLAADAAALSAARAQAEMLNTISITNLGINLYIKKAQVGSENFGEMSAEDVPGFLDWKLSLKLMVDGFRAFPAGVGRKVSQLNGADPGAPYFPPLMDSYLLPQSVHVVIIMPPPAPPIYQTFEGAYYARAWKPTIVEAQPIHTTTWVVSHEGEHSLAEATLWLDAQSGWIQHNGGFPREKESVLRGIGIQGWPAQFNAYLMSQPTVSIASVLNAWSLKR